MPNPFSHSDWEDAKDARLEALDDEELDGVAESLATMQESLKTDKETQ